MRWGWTIPRHLLHPCFTGMDDGEHLRTLAEINVLQQQWSENEEDGQSVFMQDSVEYLGSHIDDWCQESPCHWQQVESHHLSTASTVSRDWDHSWVFLTAMGSSCPTCPLTFTHSTSCYSTDSNGCSLLSVCLGIQLCEGGVDIFQGSDPLQPNFVHCVPSLP